MRVVVISPGHVGKIKRYDPGAVGMMGRERTGVMEYGLAMWKSFEEKGWLGYFTAHGTYRDRQMFANIVGAELFIAPHLNAGGGLYSLILYDRRSKVGREIAEKVRYFLDTEGWPFEIKVKDIGEGDRGFGILDLTKMPAFILEPLFVDRKEHAEFVKERGFGYVGKVWAEAFMEAMR